MYAFFAPGPMELIIILLVWGVPIAVLIAVFLIVRKSGAPAAGSAPCPNCGSHVVPQAKFCHQCGSPLQEQQRP